MKYPTISKQRMTWLYIVLVALTVLSGCGGGGLVPGLIKFIFPLIGFCCEPPDLVVGEEMYREFPEAEAESGEEFELVYSLEPDIPGLMFDPATRVLSGVPTTPGRYEVTYTAHWPATGEALVSRMYTIVVRSAGPALGGVLDGTWMFAGFTAVITGAEVTVTVGDGINSVSMVAPYTIVTMVVIKATLATEGTAYRLMLSGDEDAIAVTISDAVPVSNHPAAMAAAEAAIRTAFEDAQDGVVMIAVDEDADPDIMTINGSFLDQLAEALGLEVPEAGLVACRAVMGGTCDPPGDTGSTGDPETPGPGAPTVT